MLVNRSIFPTAAALAILLSSAASVVLASDTRFQQAVESPAFQTPLADSLPTADAPKSEPEAILDCITEADKATWSLPMEGPMGTISGGTQGRRKVARRFDASINLSDGRDPVTARIDTLMDAALQNDPETARLDRAVKHFQSRSQRAVAQTKDTVDYVVPYRGFGVSSEAGDIILGEKLKLKSRAAAEFAKQKHIDELHYKVVANVMQIAMGLGMTDKMKGAAAADSGLGSLKELVGEEEAEETYTLLQSWKEDLNVPDSVYQQGAWEVSAKETKLKTVMKDALDTDPIMQEVTRQLHKYNHRSKFARTSAHVIETTLGVAALTPDLVGPAAKAALVAFVMSTGGPEQCKLLKELYLDKRLESRAKALNEQAHLALDNYQVALLTHNPVLLACAESMVQEITGDSTINAVFGSSVLPRQAIAAGPTRQQ